MQICQVLFCRLFLECNCRQQLKDQWTERKKKKIWSEMVSSKHCKISAKVRKFTVPYFKFSAVHCTRIQGTPLMVTRCVPPKACLFLLSSCITSHIQTKVLVYEAVKSIHCFVLRHSQWRSFSSVCQFMKLCRSLHLWRSEAIYKRFQQWRTAPDTGISWDFRRLQYQKFTETQRCQFIKQW